MHSTLLHFLSACQCLHRPVNGPAKFMSMTSYSSKGTEMSQTAKCCVPSTVPGPSDPSHPSGHQALQHSQNLVCSMTSGLKSQVLTWASQADTNREKQGSAGVIKGSCAESPLWECSSTTTILTIAMYVKWRFLSNKLYKMHLPFHLASYPAYTQTAR